MDEYTEFEENLPEARTSGKTDKKCPSCGAKISYAPETRKLFCPYCDYEAELPKEENEPEVVLEIPIEKADQTTANHNWGAEKKNVKCKSCGAVSVYDATQLSDVCPYCDSNLVTEENAEESMAPQGICPFEIDKKKASKLFSEWIHGVWFAPNDLKTRAVQGALNGVYAPYWSFDTKAMARYKGQYGVDYEETDSDGNTTTHTNWYDCKGIAKHFFDDYLVPASNKENADLIKYVEPFKTAQCKPYKPEYVSGFSSERYAIGLQDCWKKAQEDIKNDKIDDYIEKDIKKHHKCDRTRIDSKEVRFFDNKFKYLLLPLWISSYRYNGKVYHFVVNGQTGKIEGDHPYSWIKITLAVLAVLAISYFIFSLLN